MTNTYNATRILRLQRLIGLDESKGLRGDLARAQRSKAQGYETWVDGRAIDAAIESMARCLAKFRAEIASIEVAS